MVGGCKVAVVVSGLMAVSILAGGCGMAPDQGTVERQAAGFLSWPDTSVADDVYSRSVSEDVYSTQ